MFPRNPPIFICYALFSKLSRGSTNAKKVTRASGAFWSNRCNRNPVSHDEPDNDEISRLILAFVNVFEKFSTNLGETQSWLAVANADAALSRIPFAFLPSPPFFSRRRAPTKLRLCNRPTCRSPAVKWKWYAYQGSRGLRAKENIFFSWIIILNLNSSNRVRMEKGSRYKNWIIIIIISRRMNRSDKWKEVITDKWNKLTTVQTDGLKSFVTSGTRAPRPGKWNKLAAIRQMERLRTSGTKQVLLVE